MGDLKFQQKFSPFTAALTYAKIRPRKVKNIGASIKSYERRNAMGRKKKIVNNSIYPDYVIESIARCLLPDMIAYYETEESQRQFAEWKAAREEQKAVL